MAARATPFTLPSMRVKSVTSRPDSRSGYVRRTIASDSFSAMEGQQVNQMIVMDGAVSRQLSAVSCQFSEDSGSPESRKPAQSKRRQPHRRTPLDSMPSTELVLLTAES